MSSIKGLEVNAAPLFVNLNALNAREAARNLAVEVTKQLGSAFNREMQIRIMDMFQEEYKKTLAEDLKQKAVPIPPPPVVEPPKVEEKKKKRS
jgi:hypothetical protein